VRPLDLLKVVQLSLASSASLGAGRTGPVGSSVAGWFADTVIPETVFPMYG
jgi:hypothetical protein